MFKLPKRVPVAPKWYVKVERRPRAEIGGDNGEWVYTTDSDPGKVYQCLGIIRIADDLGTADTWEVYTEELQHALIDSRHIPLEEDKGEAS